jgi:plasmid maintenance system killer protein
MTDAEKFESFNDSASLIAESLQIELNRESLLDKTQGYWSFRIGSRYEFIVRLTDGRFTVDTEDAIFSVDFRQDEPSFQDRQAISALNLATKFIYRLNIISRSNNEQR